MKESTDNFLLRLENVSHFFDQRLVFKNVDLKIVPGTVTLVAGPNGAGKTTLMSIVSGLIDPSRGQVDLKVRKDKIAYLGHQTFVYPGLSALDNLSFWSGIYSTEHSPEGLMDLLKKVGLKAFAYEKAGNFSRGMSQRLSLARVLMLSPLLMLLDEPGTGLDSESRKLLRETISKSSRNGVGVVWVSHTLGEDLELTDEVIFLENKRVSFYGKTKDFKVWSREKSVEN